MNMRIFVTALMLVLALASSAFAGNVALGPGATATCQGTVQPCSQAGFGASLTIDGLGYLAHPADEWVASGGTINPAVLVNLGGLYTVDFITITGVGNPGNEIAFNLYVGTNGALSSTNLGVGTLVAGSNTIQVAPAVSGAWSDTFLVPTSSRIQYVLYNVTGSNGINVDHGAGWDDAYANDIIVDAVPEPGTVGLIGAGLLALGFTLRSRRK
jgi:hypothetical protein